MESTTNNTGYVLIKARTNSEWDTCEFAIVHITEDWKKEQAKRLEAVQPFAGDYSFQSLNYYDTAVDFYKAGADDHPDIEALLEGKEWAFVALLEGEQENLAIPENRLDCYRLVVYGSGNAVYKAYGKHTSEEFWTEEFSLAQLIQQL